jgi:SAM-dependent methyltransferase
MSCQLWSSRFRLSYAVSAVRSRQLNSVKSQLSPLDIRRISPTGLIVKRSQEILEAADEQPIIDVACGGGRNAFYLAALGAQVICVDRDLSRLKTEGDRLAGTPFESALSRITPVKLDLARDAWPFPPGSAGAIINVHYTQPALFPAFASTLRSGGYLLIETVPAHGRNYLELPESGTVRQAFEPCFRLEIYNERATGPVGLNSVTVQLFGRRLADSQRRV